MVRASHDRVVQLIRQAGDTLALKVVTVKPLEKPEHWLQHHNGTMTLPNRGGARRQGLYIKYIRSRMYDVLLKSQA